MPENAAPEQSNRPILMYVIATIILFIVLLAVVYFAQQRGSSSAETTPNDTIATETDRENIQTEVIEQNETERQSDESRSENSARSQESQQEDEEAVAAGSADNEENTPGSIASAGPSHQIVAVLLIGGVTSYAWFEYRRSRLSFRNAALRRSTSL